MLSKTRLVTFEYIYNSIFTNTSISKIILICSRKNVGHRSIYYVVTITKPLILLHILMLLTFNGKVKR